MAIPVLEGRAAAYANFPKAHSLHMGSNLAMFHDDTDLVLLVESRVPWYPPSNVPPNATIVAISESPLKEHMVYQNLEAGVYLEGNVARSLSLVTSGLQERGASAGQHTARRTRLAAQHEARIAKNHDRQAAAEKASGISTAWLCRLLNNLLPEETIYVDETIVHSTIIRELLDWNLPGSFQRTPSGLGQGLGIALGAKLAAPERPVVMLIGDGSFLYNPVLPCLAFSKEHSLPLLIVILNNNKYEIMRTTHLSWYPDGVAASQNLHYGVHLENPDYAMLAAWTGGMGRRIADPALLPEAIRSACATVQEGRTAILNVMTIE